MAVLGSSATFQGLQTFSHSAAFLVQISHSERAKEKGKDARVFKFFWYSGAPDLFSRWWSGKRIAAIYRKEKTSMVVSWAFSFSEHLSILFLAWQLWSEMCCILSWHQHLLSSDEREDNLNKDPTVLSVVVLPQPSVSSSPLQWQRQNHKTTRFVVNILLFSSAKILKQLTDRQKITLSSELLRQGQIPRGNSVEYFSWLLFMLDWG